MPQPTPNASHVDGLLTNISIGYKPQGFIASDIYPVVTVGKQSNLYAIYPKDHWFRQSNTLRAPGTKGRRGGFTVGSGTYLCQNYDFGTDVWDETIANADNPLQPLQDGVEYVRTQLALDQEIRVAAQVDGGVGSSSTLTGLSAWSDFDNSDPLTDIRVARQAIRSTTGLRPNTAIIGQKAWDVVRDHPDFVRRAFPGAGIGGTLTQEQFASVILNVDRVLIGETIKNTAAEGATATFTDVWSTHLYLAYVAPSPGLMTPSFGYQFRWNMNGSSNPPAFAIRRKYEEEMRTTILWTDYYQDERTVAPELGFKIATGIS
jgi:hypothetical protein